MICTYVVSILFLMDGKLGLVVSVIHRQKQTGRMKKNGTDQMKVTDFCSFASS
jgi:hypothetical protein